MGDPSAPIVVDLGGASAKRLRQLKQGDGPLKAEVRDVLGQIRERVGPDLQQQLLVPVVVIYSRKKKRRQLLIDLLSK